MPDPITLQDAVGRVERYLQSKPGASSRMVAARLQAPAEVDPARAGGLGQPIDAGTWIVEVARDKMPGEALDPPVIRYHLNIATDQLVEELGTERKVIAEG